MKNTREIKLKILSDGEQFVGEVLNAESIEELDNLSAKLDKTLDGYRNKINSLKRNIRCLIKTNSLRGK